MKVGIAVVVLAGLLGSEDTFAAFDGNSLLPACKGYITVLDTQRDGGDSFKAGQCVGIMGATIYTMSTFSTVPELPAHLRTCFPNDISIGQAARIVVKYLEDNPAKLNQDRNLLTMVALHRAYPCN